MKKTHLVPGLALLGLWSLALPARAGWPDVAMATNVGPLEIVATFNGAMPTGVAVSQDRRVFLSFPLWDDPTPFTVGELKNGVLTAYPDGDINTLGTNDPATRFVSVQAVVMDPRNRLWVLDSGSLNFQAPLTGGPKLVGLDLSSNHVFTVITFPGEVALPTSYLNDVRIDLLHGRAGTAFITDSGNLGPNAIIVVDLATGRSRRVLNGNYSVRPESGFVPVVDGGVFMQRSLGRLPEPMTTGVDGLAVDGDGIRLYYCALSSHHLYSVLTGLLLDENAKTEDVMASVRKEGVKPGSDGLEADALGHIYVTDYEHNAILRRDWEGNYEMIATDPRMVWPDTLCLAPDGYLYITSNELCRGARFHDGKDLRQKPYYLFRVRVDDAPPVVLDVPHVTAVVVGR